MEQYGLLMLQQSTIIKGVELLRGSHPVEGGRIPKKGVASRIKGGVSPRRGSHPQEEGRIPKKRVVSPKEENRGETMLRYDELGSRYQQRKNQGGKVWTD